MSRYTNYVFGYGSIVDPRRLKTFLGRTRFAPADYHFCRLPGYRRVWNVAMNNQVDIPGYKYYLDKRTGQRPPIFVTFLNVYPCSNQAIDGLLFGVTAAELNRLDRRERNYERIRVETQISRPTAGRVWLYRGRPEAKARFQTGVRQQRAVISKDYHDLVANAFAGFGEAALTDYLASTDAPTVPLQDLQLMR